MILKGKIKERRTEERKGINSKCKYTDIKQRKGKGRYVGESNEIVKQRYKFAILRPCPISWQTYVPGLQGVSCRWYIMHTNRTPSQCRFEDGCSTAYMH
jgi:hypothetical protein